MTSSRLRRCEARLFNPPPTDLRDYLTKKRSANQATSSCCCQQLIHMLTGCHCGSGANQQSLIRQLTLIPPSAKRRRSHRRRTFSDVKYPELTAYMTSRSKGKQPAVSSDESDSEPEGVYQHTRTRTGTIPPVDYNALAHGIRTDNSHSAVIESQASNSSVEKETSAYMVGAPEETARRIEQMQKHQMDIITSQQRSIDSLKYMLEKLLEERERSPSRRPKGKGRRFIFRTFRGTTAITFRRATAIYFGFVQILVAGQRRPKPGKGSC